MTAQDANAFLMGGGFTSAFSKDDPIGYTVIGTVCDPAPEVRQQTDLQTGDPLTWNDGSPKMQLVVTIQTTLRADGDDDGKRRLFIKGKSLTDSVREAVRKAGAPGLELGGTLTVQLTGTEPSQTRGFNDRKLYAAAYARPDLTAASGEFLGVQQQTVAQPPPPPVAPQPIPQPVVPQPITQPAPPPPVAAAPSAPTPQYGPEQLAALKSAGFTDEQIANMATAQ